MVIKAPKAASADECERLEQLPNIGPALAADLRLIGIERPADLRGQDACVLYQALCEATGQRQDPCVLDTFMAADRFHARRAGRAVVDVHGDAQGDLRNALSPRLSGLAGMREQAGRNPTVRTFAAPCGAEQSSAGHRWHSRRRLMLRALPYSLCATTLRCRHPPAGLRRRASRRSRSKRRAARWSSRLSDWLGVSGWRVSRVDFASSFGQRGRLDELAAARLEFADALIDIHTVAAGDALDRIAATRSLRELWHFRGEVFDLVSLRHDQAEAERRWPSSTVTSPGVGARPLARRERRRRLRPDR